MFGISLRRPILNSSGVVLASECMVYRDFSRDAWYGFQNSEAAIGVWAIEVRELKTATMI